MNETQRAVIAGRLANMKQGTRTDVQPSANLPKVISQPEAATMLNVSPQTVYQLYQAIAEQLAGKPVLLRFQQPQYKNYLGCCHMNRRGQIVIDVSPHLDNEQTLRVFLHECAHARLHKFIPSDTNKTAQSIAPQTPRNAIQAGVTNQHEAEADKLAAEWLKIANYYDTEEAALWRLYRTITTRKGQ